MPLVLLALFQSFTALAGEPVPAAPAETPPAETPPAALKVYEGTILSRKGDSITLTTTGGEAPAVGATGSLSKHIVKQMFGPEVVMWLTVADVKVSAVGKTTVTLTIVEETSVITVDGQKVDHFTKDSKTRLEWAAP